MKYLKIIICVFLILAGPFFDSWNDFSTEHNILTQLLRILGLVYICHICIRFLLNRKKTVNERQMKQYMTTPEHSDVPGRFVI